MSGFYLPMQFVIVLESCKEQNTILSCNHNLPIIYRHVGYRLAINLFSICNILLHRSLQEQSFQLDIFQKIFNFESTINKWNSIWNQLQNSYLNSNLYSKHVIYIESIPSKDNTSVRIYHQKMSFQRVHIHQRPHRVYTVVRYPTECHSHNLQRYNGSIEALEMVLKNRKVVDRGEAV